MRDFEASEGAPQRLVALVGAHAEAELRALPQQPGVREVGLPLVIIQASERGRAPLEPLFQPVFLYNIYT